MLKLLVFWLFVATASFAGSYLANLLFHKPREYGWHSRSDEEARHNAIMSGIEEGKVRILK